MKAAGSRRDRIRAQLADLKMPGALEAVDDVLTRVDGGGVTPSEAIEQVFGLTAISPEAANALRAELENEIAEFAVDTLRFVQQIPKYDSVVVKLAAFDMRMAYNIAGSSSNRLAPMTNTSVSYSAPPLVCNLCFRDWFILWGLL